MTAWRLWGQMKRLLGGSASRSLALWGGFELVDAATASAVPRADTEMRASPTQSSCLLSIRSITWTVWNGSSLFADWITLLIAAGRARDTVRLYRAMTRAQLAVAVVNQTLPRLARVPGARRAWR